LEHLRALGVKGVVIYGLLSNNHSHHYIHKSFHKAFQSIIEEEPDLEVHWCDDTPNVLNENRNMLFLSYAIPGYCDRFIPLNNSNFYLVHGTSSENALRYMTCFDKTLFFDEYRGDPNSQARMAHNYVANALISSAQVSVTAFQRCNPDPRAFYEHVNASTRTVVTTWATDLLPHEIESATPELKPLMEVRRASKSVVFVGSVWHRNLEAMHTLVDACCKLGLTLEIYGGFIDDGFRERHAGSAIVEKRDVSDEESRWLISRAHLAPTVQGEGQIGYYVPCRLFKNLSYGAAALSNNRLLAELLDTGCLVETDMQKLIELGSQSARNFDIDHLEHAMMEVARKHTYLSRINFLLQNLVALQTRTN